MPSAKKMGHFMSSALLTAGGIVILGYAMSTDWAVSKMECSSIDSDRFNGTVTVTFGLFNGSEDKISCPFFNNIVRIELLKHLEEIGGAAHIFHALVITLLVLALVGSAGSLLVTLYNSVSNPYQTYMGPIGLYACSGTSATLTFLALILFVINIFATGVSKELVKLDNAVNLRNETVKLQLGFFLLIPYIVLHLLAILLVFLYQHTAYTQRKEQEKPTEDAPKDIMMF